MLKIDGAKIRQSREAKGLTQLYVATFVGVTTDTVSRWENLHYQTIKRENAEKLAEALEVPLEEILLRGNEGKPPAALILHKRWSLTRIGKIWFWVPILFVLLFGIYWYLYDKQPKTDVIALRQLPDHVPPGQIFPVMLTVQTQSDTAVSIIITEQLPEGLQVIGGVPPYQTLDRKKRTVKWILSAKRRATISYIVRSDTGIKAKSLGFTGSILVRQQKATPMTIAGNNAVQIEPYHWADTNKDNLIDDEEILTVYDLYQGLQGHETLRTQLETIWAGSNYIWDEKERRYVVGP